MASNTFARNSAAVFSKSYQYALRATVVVALASRKGNRLNLSQIAERTGAPKAFTAKVLQDLVRAGIINSQRGPSGGFELPPARAHEISLRRIMEALGESAFYRQCIMGLSSCSSQHPCPMHEQFAQVKDAMTTILETTEVHSLVENLNNGTTRVKL